MYKYLDMRSINKYKVWDEHLNSIGVVDLTFMFIFFIFKLRNLLVINMLQVCLLGAQVFTKNAFSQSPKYPR